MILTQRDRRLLLDAETISFTSPDPSTKCGAVIAWGAHVVSQGHNTFPYRVEVTAARMMTRDIKLRMMIHAEVNSLLQLLLMREAPPLEHCTMYIHDSLPCCNCAGAIIQSGLRRIVLPRLFYTDPVREARWHADHELALMMLIEAGVTVLPLEG